MAQDVKSWVGLGVTSMSDLSRHMCSRKAGYHHFCVETNTIASVIAYFCTHT
jgi:hypothetical protein